MISSGEIDCCRGRLAKKLSSALTALSSRCNAAISSSMVCVVSCSCPRAVPSASSRRCRGTTTFISARTCARLAGQLFEHARANARSCLTSSTSSRGRLWRRCGAACALVVSPSFCGDPFCCRCRARRACCSCRSILGTLSARVGFGAPLRSLGRAATETNGGSMRSAAASQLGQSATPFALLSHNKIDRAGQGEMAWHAARANQPQP